MLIVEIGGDVSIAKAIRPITYKKTSEVKGSLLFLLDEMSVLSL